MAELRDGLHRRRGGSRTLRRLHVDDLGVLLDHLGGREDETRDHFCAGRGECVDDGRGERVAQCEVVGRVVLVRGVEEVF